MTDSIERMKQLQAERIEELARHEIKAERGRGVLGLISLPAMQASKLLTLLRRLKRLEEREARWQAAVGMPLEQAEAMARGEKEAGQQ